MLLDGCLDISVLLCENAGNLRSSEMAA